LFLAINGFAKLDGAAVLFVQNWHFLSRAQRIYDFSPIPLESGKNGINLSLESLQI